MRFGLLAPFLLLTVSSASAQTQIKPRVLLMVDTSGSMTEHLNDGNSTYGDGSSSYADPGFSSTSYYRGVNVGSITSGALNGTCNAAFDGANSRMFAAKAA